MEQLTERQKEIYTQVEDYRKKNPDSSNMAIFKVLKVNPSTYAAAKKKIGTPKRKYHKRPEMITLPVAESTPHVVAFVSSSHLAVVDSVNEFLRRQK